MNKLKGRIELKGRLEFCGEDEMEMGCSRSRFFRINGEKSEKRENK